MSEILYREISADFTYALSRKSGFSAITPLVSILDPMLLHNTYINEAIANIFMCQKSLYDLPGPKCKNPQSRESKKGRGQKHLYTMEFKIGIQLISLKYRPNK